MNKIALIPSYCPDENLIKLVKELKDNNYKIVVVNDGSNPSFNPIFNEIKEISHVITYKKNMGKGYALKKGLKYINDNFNNYIIVTLDSDGQHKVSDANKLVNYAKNNLDTLVLGKRIRSKKTPLKSRLGNSITKLVFSLNTGLDIYDTQTGLRAFSNKLINYMIETKGNRYEYEMNVLLYLKQYNIKYKEIEIETIYINNNSNSHFNAIKDSYKIYKEIIKFSMSSFISFIIDFIFYSMFLIISNNLIISNILARFISSICNYNINKKLVFNSKNKSLVSYYLLVIIVLLLNTYLLTLLTYMNINKFIAKLLVEIILFILSYIVQKKIIFNRKRKYEIKQEKIV
ncbi:MAG: glycosyltransferase family 2 protein [Bacilli bacterium]|nr:glycosyltransferase family 2 protein [Bacilli bacterium]